MFQSLKRDHSSSDLAAQFRYTGIELVSIAQARPFLFRLGDADTTRFAKLQFQSLKRDHSSSDAGGRTGGGTMLTFQSLKRDHSSSDCEKGGGFGGKGEVSIAQARPFLFRLAMDTGMPSPSLKFQSLKRDHSSSDK